MHNFKYVEDYIEFIAGFIDSAGNEYVFWDRKSSGINLARYDEQIIQSLATQTRDIKNAYTQKQSELAIKLINKYRRQLARRREPILVPDEDYRFRLGIRTVDTSQKIYLDKDRIWIRFPFNTKIIDVIKDYSKICLGGSKYHKDKKIWSLGVTEHNINFAVNLGEMFKFDISDELKNLYSKILEVEVQPFKIALTKNHHTYSINNACQDLNDYVNNHCGGFGIDNFLQLVDISSVLGFSVPYSLVKQVYQTYGRDIARLILKRQIHLKPNTSKENYLDLILQYAKLTGRGPIYLYDTTLSKADRDDVIYLNNKTIIDNSCRIGLLVSKSSFLIGPRKTNWLRKAEKIIIIS